MFRNLILCAIATALLALCGCGGKNGLIGGSGSGVILTSIAMTPANPTIAFSKSPAATQQFTVIGTYNMGNPKDITSQMTWQSLDPSVATIDSNGKATAVNSGRVIVTGMIEDPTSLKTFQASTILAFVPQLTGISVSPASAKIAQGTTIQISAIGSYNDGSTVDITSQVSWNSSHPGVATVSGSPGTQGVAMGIVKGSSSITATLGTVTSAAAVLTVSDANLVSIAVTPQDPTFGLANSQPLVAQGSFDDGSTQDLSRDVIWATANNPSAVVRVSAAGMATGVGLGSETVIATLPSSGISGSTGLTVDDSSVAAVNVLPLPMLTFSRAQFPVPFLATGTGQQMRAVAIFHDGSTQDVTNVQGTVWSTADATVASIDPVTALMTTKGPGSTTITAALGSKQGSAPLNVGNAQLKSLVVAPNGATVAQGGVQNVVAMATFLAADNLTVFQQDVSELASWSSDNPSVAMVGDLMGLKKIAQGVSTGAANLTATFSLPGGGAVSASAVLNVSSGVLSAVKVAPATAAVPLDGGYQYVATGVFTDGTEADVTLLANWSSGSSTIATVGRMGYAAANGPGQTSIRADFNSQNESAALIVNPAALAKIDICAATVADPLVNCPPLDPVPSPPAISIGNQTMFGLVAIGTFTDGSRQDLTGAVRWSSGSLGAATVSNDSGIPGITTGAGQRGVVTGGLQGGTAQITASAGGISSTVNVLVSSAPLQQLTITPKDGLVALGTPQQCQVTATFSDGSMQDVTPLVQWSSLSPDVAVVGEGGIAYPTGKGIAEASLDPSSLVVAPDFIRVTMVNPSPTKVFSWPVGSVFQFHGLTVSSGDVFLLNDTPFMIVSESDPADSQHVQPCKPGQNCDIRFATPLQAPASGSYTVTAGDGKASAAITATMNVVVDSVPTQVSGSATLTVQ